MQPQGRDEAGLTGGDWRAAGPGGEGAPEPGGTTTAGDGRRSSNAVRIPSAASSSCASGRALTRRGALCGVTYVGAVADICCWSFAPLEVATICGRPPTSPPASSSSPPLTSRPCLRRRRTSHVPTPTTSASPTTPPTTPPTMAPTLVPPPPSPSPSPDEPSGWGSTGVSTAFCERPTAWGMLVWLGLGKTRPT